MPSPLKIIFAGTPEFASQALAALLKTDHQVIAVYTQPDRPAGRGRKLTPSPVKQLAEQQHIAVYQPDSFMDNADVAHFQQLQADLMVVAAYGLLLPKKILEAPRLGCLNIHASLLPRWRGAAPIQRAILAGDKETGITIMQMDEGLDTGDMLLKKSCQIEHDDTAVSLHDRLTELGAESIVEALHQLDSLTAEKQNNDKATYAKKLHKEEAFIDWSESVESIERKIRAFNSWPVAQTKINDQTLRIWQAEVFQSAKSINRNEITNNPGTIIATEKSGIDIACGQGVLRILKIQPAGSKPMDISSFLNGRADLLKVGSRLIS